MRLDGCQTVHVDASIDIDDALAGYEAWLVRRGRERSLKRYRATVRRYLVDSDAYMKMLVSARYSPNYRRFLAACAKSWATYAEDGKLLAELADIRLPAPIARDTREPFDTETWESIRDEIRRADYLSPGVRAVCSIIAVRGIRCGDILRATQSDVDKALKTGVFTYVAKGEKIQRYNARYFREHLETLQELFETLDVGRWDTKDPSVRCLVCRTGKPDAATSAIIRAFNNVAESLGLDPAEVHAHRFRHTYATHFLQAMAGDPEAVFKLKDQMGWSRLETAANYLRRSRQEELDDIESQLLGDT